MSDTAKFARFKRALFDRRNGTGWDKIRGIRSSHVLKLNGIVIYVKDSSLESGWWGVNKTIWEKLKNLDCDLRLVLLAGDGEVGYLFSKPEVAGIIDSANGDSYIVHEINLRQSSAFQNFDECFFRLGL